MTDALTLRKIRGFSIERLRGQQVTAKEMIARAKVLYPLLVREVHAEFIRILESERSEGSTSRLNTAASNKVTVQWEETNELIKDTQTTRGLLTEDELELDLNHRGRFIKGEWIPFHRLPVEIQREIELEMSQRKESRRGKSRGSNKLVVLASTTELGSMSTLEDRPSTVNSKPATRGKRKKQTKEELAAEIAEMDNQIMENEATAERIDCYHFVSTMLAFLRAIVRFSLDGEKLKEKKQLTAEKSMLLEDLKAKHKEALSHYHSEVALREEMEKDLITFKKRVKSMEKRVKLFRNKVRVARLLNRVSVNGHTPISWAASLGAFDIVEEMLSRGSTVGFTPELMNYSATYLQMSYKIYLTSLKIKPQRVLDPETAKYVIRKPEAVNTHEVLVQLEKLKEKRLKILKIIQFQRNRTRFPIPEAIYTAKWEIIKRVHERRLLHSNFLSSWVFPCPPPPYRRNTAHQYEHSKISPYELLAHGMNDIAAGIYVAEIGWVNPNDPREPFGETQKELKEILDELKERKAQVWFRNNRILFNFVSTLTLRLFFSAYS